MGVLADLLKDILSAHAFLQIFVGGCTMLLIAYMVMRARGDRERLPLAPGVPAPASGTMADVPPPFLHGPIDLIRESRDHLRRVADNSERLVECVRLIREETRRQTDLLDRIEREQAVENRVHERGRE